MTQVTEDSFAGMFAGLRRTQASEPAWRARQREEAFALFNALGMPTRHDEEWRFTPIAPIIETPFALPAGNPVVETLPADLAGVAEIEAVFVNGKFDAERSSLGALPAGVTVQSLAQVLAAEPDALASWLGSTLAASDGAFTALNAAFAEDGAVIRIAPGTVCEQPIHLRFVSGGVSQPMLVSPRTLVIAGPASQATIIESYSSLPGAVTLTNAVTEIVAAEGAVIDHYKVQSESFEAFHIARMNVALARDTNVSSHSFTFGGGIVRNDIAARLGGEGGECTLNGLYYANGRRLIDNHTAIDHALPHCQSHELYKGILNDRARGVFNGKIYVKPDAQKTDAKQTNKTLLLSEQAQINTKPQLEIFADDVKCTHGATVGQLDADALFYLRARGIGVEAARAMLTRAFAIEVVDRIKPERLREAVDALLATLMPA